MLSHNTVHTNNNGTPLCGHRGPVVQDGQTANCDRCAKIAKARAKLVPVAGVVYQTAMGCTIRSEDVTAIAKVSRWGSSARTTFYLYTATGKHFVRISDHTGDAKKLLQMMADCVRFPYPTRDNPEDVQMYNIPT